MKQLVVLAAICMSAAAPVHAADTSESAPSWTTKLGTMQILIDARSGVPQNLIVELDAGVAERTFAAKRAAIAAPSAPSLSGDLDAKLIRDHRRDLDALKDTVFPHGRLLGATVVRNFQNSPIVLVWVPSLEALEAIAMQPRVKFINRDAEVSPASN